VRIATALLVCFLSALVAGAQEPVPERAGSVPVGVDVPGCGFCHECPTGLHWPRDCFPHCGCPDDYCPHPFPRQCWPPYPPFYQCVPAGHCGHPPCVGVGNEKLTWWFLPTPRALREALWCHP
jgi:hypothetical protein